MCFIRNYSHAKKHGWNNTTEKCTFLQQTQELESVIHVVGVHCLHGNVFITDSLAAIDATGTEPDNDPTGAEEKDDEMETVVGTTVLFHPHYHLVSHSNKMC